MRNISQEDAYLREQYPVYADSRSVFTVLKAGDALEANDRTEKQIMRRVKMLGLKAASEEIRPTTGGASDAETKQALPQSSDEGPGSGRRERQEEASGVEEEVARTSPLHVRKIDRKSQVQSDDN